MWWDTRNKSWPYSRHISSCPHWLQEKLARLQGIKAYRARYKTAWELVVAIKQCSETRDLEAGRKLHMEATCHLDNNHVASALIKMYSRCGSMQLARDVFDRTTRKDVVTWTCLILGYVENGERSEALATFTTMDCAPDRVAYVAALKACAGLASERASDRQILLEKGVAIHERAKEHAFDTNIVVANTLVEMYSKCGCMQLAKEAFERVVRKDAAIWTCLILGYVENGQSSIAMELFTSMDCEPDRVTYLAALKALANERVSERHILLNKGRAIHEQVKERGFDSNIAIRNSLVDMYSKCGNMHLAREVFEGTLLKDIVTWNSLILGYVDNGESSVALDLFMSMNYDPDCVTYLAALKACASLGSEEKGISIHERVRESSLESNVAVASALVDMYGKCGNMKLSREAFEKMARKEVITWNSLMLGYVENGESTVALELFYSMDCAPNRVTYLAALKACADLAFTEKGMEIHERIRERTLDSNLAVANALVDMYSRCGCMRLAKEVFDKVIYKDVAIWTSLILGYVENGESSTALELFNSMDSQPDRGAYVAALKACSSLASERALENGMVIHRQIKERALDSIVLTNSLVDMYRKCGDMQLTREVFDWTTHKDVVTWTSLIVGYVENGESLEALELFNSMDCEPDQVAYLAALKACASLVSEKGKSFLDYCIAIHEQVKDRGFHSDTSITNAVVDMYRKAGNMLLARETFERMMHKDVVTWNCLVLGYVENGESPEALELFITMDCEPNRVTYLAVLKACACLAALPTGKLIHGTVCKLGLEEDASIANLLVDFYGSCGRMATAIEVFNIMQSPDIASWTALIAGYSSLGESLQVFSLARKILEAGLHMDAVTFVCILTTCSHAGIVEEGRMCFESMHTHGVRPTLEHYNIMVDMLGRANRFDEALAIVKTMPFKANKVTWITLLEACKKHRNLEVSRVAFDALMASDRKTAAAAYVIMRDIYALI